MTALAALLLSVAAPVPKVSPADPFVVGTKWVYACHGDEKTTETQEVTRNEEADGVRAVTIVVTSPGGKKGNERYTLSGGDLRMIAHDEAKYDPPVLVLKAGMKGSDTWANSFSRNGSAHEMTCTVGEAHEVTTPAGKFTALPVTHNYTKPLVGFARPTTYWYADGVGLVRVSREGEKTPVRELQSFTPGKK